MHRSCSIDPLNRQIEFYRGIFGFLGKQDRKQDYDACGPQDQPPAWTPFHRAKSDELSHGPQWVIRSAARESEDEGGLSSSPEPARFILDTGVFAEASDEPGHLTLASDVTSTEPAREISSMDAAGAKVESNHSLVGSEVMEQMERAHLSQGDDTPTSNSVAYTAPSMVALPSAVMLEAAFAKNANGAADVLKLVAEAMADGSRSDAIEAMLQAASPSQAGFPLAGGMLTMAGSGHDEYGGLAAQHVLPDQMLLIHPDALPMA